MTSKVVSLGDVAEFINGFAFKPEDWSETGLPIIRIQNLTGYGRELNRTLREVPSKYLVRQGDLLVSWSATLGVYVWKGQDALVNQHIFKVEPRLDRIHLDYLRHAIDGSIHEMERFTHGSTMKHINRKEFLDHKIPLPPLDEQKRIAAILDKADQLRQKRRQAIALLDSLTQSIFLEMFGDPDRNLLRLDYVPLIELVDPKDRLNYGVVQPGEDVENGVPLIRVSDLGEGVVDRSKLRLIDPQISRKHSKSVLKGTEILISCVGSIGEIALDDGPTTPAPKKSLKIIGL